MAVRPIIRGIVRPIVRDTYGEFDDGPATGPPVNVIPPDASGIPYIGGTVSTTRGAWTENPTVYQYQWFQGSPGAETLIPGAESMSYICQAGDLGLTLFCRVTASNGQGSTDADSDVIGPVFDATDYRVDGDGDFRVVDDGDYRITGG